jgi:hypothetical protein
MPNKPNKFQIGDTIKIAGSYSNSKYWANREGVIVACPGDPYPLGVKHGQYLPQISCYYFMKFDDREEPAGFYETELVLVSRVRETTQLVSALRRFMVME